MLDMLRDDQNTVDWLDDGPQALNALSHEYFDLVIMVLTLPRMDGLDILKSIRNQGVQTPVIILSARAGLDDKLQGLVQYLSTHQSQDRVATVLAITYWDFRQVMPG